MEEQTLDVEYVNVVKKIQAIQQSINLSCIPEIDEKIHKLQTLKAAELARFNEELEPLLKRKEQLIEAFRQMYKGEKKLPYGLLNLEYRITKSLIVKNPTLVVDTLQKLNKIDEGVKTFNLTFLRKLHDANIFPQDSVEYEEKINVYITEILNAKK